jgi:hypothetical protein
MKVIYMEETILIMSQKDPQGTQELIQRGIIKKTENDKPYLVIEDEN